MIFLKLSYADTDSEARALFNDCIRQLKSEEYKKAAGSCEEAVRIKPDYGEAFFALGYAYDKLGEKQKALESFKEAIRIRPEFAQAHTGLGISCAKLSRHHCNF